MPVHLHRREKGHDEYQYLNWFAAIARWAQELGNTTFTLPQVNKSSSATHGPWRQHATTLRMTFPMGRPHLRRIGGGGHTQRTPRKLLGLSQEKNTRQKKNETLIGSSLVHEFRCSPPPGCCIYNIHTRNPNLRTAWTPQTTYWSRQRQNRSLKIEKQGFPAERRS